MAGWGRGCPSPRNLGFESPSVAPPLTLSLPGCSRANGPQGHPEQSHSCRHLRGVMAALSAGTGDVGTAVIDPDMVALFEEFLGKGTARWAWRPCPHVCPMSLIPMSL